MCHAEQIAIDVDQHAREAYDTEFADEWDSHKATAETSSVTCCHTFQPKR